MLDQHRRHEVNINHHCINDFPGNEIDTLNGFFIGVSFGVCSLVIAVVVLGFLSC